MSEPTTDPAGPDDVAATPADAALADSEADGVAAADGSAAGDGAPGFGAHPIVLYTIKRFLLLVVVGAVLYLVGIRGVWLILFSFLVSGFIAMIALRGSREGAAYGITHAVKKVNDRIDESSRAEDYDDLDDDLAEPAATETPATDDGDRPLSP